MSKVQPNISATDLNACSGYILYDPRKKNCMEICFHLILFFDTKTEFDPMYKKNSTFLNIWLLNEAIQKWWNFESVQHLLTKKMTKSILQKKKNMKLLRSIFIVQLNMMRSKKKNGQVFLFVLVFFGFIFRLLIRFIFGNSNPNYESGQL